MPGLKEPFRWSFKPGERSLKQTRGWRRTSCTDTMDTVRRSWTKRSSQQQTRNKKAPQVRVLLMQIWMNFRRSKPMRRGDEDVLKNYITGLLSYLTAINQHATQGFYPVEGKASQVCSETLYSRSELRNQPNNTAHLSNSNSRGSTWDVKRGCESSKQRIEFWDFSKKRDFYALL